MQVEGVSLIIVLFWFWLYVTSLSVLVVSWSHSSLVCDLIPQPVKLGTVSVY